MSPPELLAELRRLGVLVTASGGNLFYSAQRGVLSPGLRQGIHDQKRELTRLLVEEQIHRQLDCLVPSGDNGVRPYWVHRDLLRPERTRDLEFIDLVSWFLNRKPISPPSPPSRPCTSREACLETARGARYPCVEIRPGERVVGTADAWERFCSCAVAGDVTAALDVLKALACRAPTNNPVDAAHRSGS